MTLSELRDNVRKWDSQNNEGEAIASSKYTSILTQIEHHANNEWKQYLPAVDPDINSNYMERLATWISNVDEENDQKLLLEYALHISFFSHDDFIALCQTAFNREVFQWVAFQSGSKLSLHGNEGFHDIVYNKVKHQTWYCPVTDSMDINEFNKVNHLSGISQHPGFSTLQVMAEHPDHPNLQIVDDWTRYMSNPSDDPRRPHPPLEYLVLLEDIVGSGSQCLNTIRWAVENFGVPVLFIPLILCPNGVDALRQEEVKYGGRLTVRPVIELSRSDLLGPERKGQAAWPITESLENLAVRYSAEASPGCDTFGYRNTGCSIATFANTPDNTLPIVHNKPEQESWEPLFPRIYRD